MPTIRRILFTLIMVSLVSTVAVSQSSSKIRKDQRRNRQQIEKVQRDVQLNAKAVEGKLHDLQLLDGQIVDLNRDIKKLYRTSDSLMRIIRPLNDSIAAMNEQLNSMRSRYAAALRKSQSNAAGMNDLTFVFSSSTFKQAWERYRSLRQFSRWRKRKGAEIVQVRGELEVRRQRLDSLRRSNNKILKSVELQRDEIERKKIETDRLVSSLRTQTKQLQQILKKRQQEARQLEEKLEKAIADEIEAQRLKEEQELKEQARQEEERRREFAEQQKKKDGQSSDASNTGSSSGKSNSNHKDNKSADTATNNPGASGAGADSRSGNGTQSGTSSSGTSSSNDASSHESATLSQINRRLTGSFESNRGKLPYPVSGKLRLSRSLVVRNILVCLRLKPTIPASISRHPLMPLSMLSLTVRFHRYSSSRVTTTSLCCVMVTMLQCMPMLSH